MPQVCHAASQYLDMMWSVPLIDLNMVDSEVFVAHPDLARMQQLREELCKLKTRLPMSVATELLNKHVPRQYLFDSSDTLALCDYIGAARGEFGPILSSAIEQLHLAISASPDAQHLARQRVPLKGFLHKQSHQSSKWLKRWFVLEDGCIRCVTVPGVLGGPCIMLTVCRTVHSPFLRHQVLEEAGRQGQGYDDLH